MSIIIPTFQRRELLDQTLQSIVSQSWTDWECMVVDDGSTDGTRELVEELHARDPRFRWIEKPVTRPRGPSTSRNIGLAAAKGDFVLFFDSDDLLPPGHLEACMSRILAGGSDYLVCRIRMFDDANPSGTTDSPLMNPDDFIGRAIAGEHLVFSQNVIWKRSLLARTGQLREDITMVEDLEFAVRAMLLASPPILANDLFVLVRRHLNSLTFEPSPQRFVQRNLHMYDAYHSVVRNMELNGFFSETARRYCAKRRYDLVVEVLKRGYPSWNIARRYAQLLRWSIREPVLRTMVRLTVLAPVFWGMAFWGALTRWFPKSGRPGG